MVVDKVVDEFVMHFKEGGMNDESGFLWGFGPRLLGLWVTVLW